MHPVVSKVMLDIDVALLGVATKQEIMRPG